MSLDHSDLNARVFSAFYRTLQSEGFNKDEAYGLAQRGAELLTASPAPSARDPGKPASAAAGGEAAENTLSKRPYTYLFSNLTITRRLALTAFMLVFVLASGTVFYAVLEWARAPRNERSVGRASHRRDRSISLVFSSISLLILIIGMIIFIMHEL